MEEKIQIVNALKIKEIPMPIKTHGVHELCFVYQGHNGEFD